MAGADHAPLLPGMRRLLILAGVLVSLAGIQLFVFSERTAEYFAWTIDPPLTAAFLGAAYWSSALFEFSAARERLWAHARISVPTVFVFTVATLAVTLIHLDRFHLGPDFGAVTRAVTWLWLAIYVIVPLTMIVLWWNQSRAADEDPPILVALPATLRGLVGAQALLLVAIGFALLLAPATAASLWPWSLTPLTGRAIGAWLLSLGVAAGHAVVENCARRLRPAAWGYLGFALLQSWALLRYPDDVDWSNPAAAIYVLFLASTLVVGVTGLRLSRRQPPPPSSA
jgi:hypothetical protein